MERDNTRTFPDEDDASYDFQWLPSFATAIEEILKNLKRRHNAGISDDTHAPLSPVDFHCIFGPTASVYDSLVRGYLTSLIVPAIVALVLQMGANFISTDDSDENRKPFLGLDTKIVTTRKFNVGLSSFSIISTMSTLFFVDNWRSRMREMNMNLITKSIRDGMFNVFHYETFHNDRRLLEVTSLTWWESTGKKVIVTRPLTIFLTLCCVLCVHRSLFSRSESDGLLEASVEPKSLLWYWIIYRRMIIGGIILWSTIWLFMELARLLTAWENPYCLSEYISSVIQKTAFFGFIIIFYPFFYVCFFMENAEKTNYFWTLLLVLMFLNVLSDLIHCLRSSLSNGARPEGNNNNNEENEWGDIEYYQDSMSIFLPLFAQIGLVLIFSTVVPLLLLFSILFCLVSFPLKAYRICSLGNIELLQTSLEAMLWKEVLCVELAFGCLATAAILIETSNNPSVHHNIFISWGILLLNIVLAFAVSFAIKPDDRKKEATLIRLLYPRLDVDDEEEEALSQALDTYRYSNVTPRFSSPAELPRRRTLNTGRESLGERMDFTFGHLPRYLYRRHRIS